jgi:exodeoxyribonuclease VII large subunit
MTDVLTVTEVTRRIRDLIESRVGSVWVEGEISNYRKQSSGHHYFTLKDQHSQLACAMFARSYGAQSRVTLNDGVHVKVFGQITVYEARGQYQMIVQLVQPRGQGVLQARFEALKRKLDAEGLFAASRKRALPPFPRRIAIVTSASGAALQDMLKILQRRSPWLRVLICPVRVQGTGAAQEMSTMVKRLNERAGALAIDLLVLARGGGSLEDLWEFNEEILARAVAASELPVVSAVGHEIDFTICDFVADLRAPTPSAAAEMVAPDKKALEQRLTSRRISLDRCAHRSLEMLWLRLRQLAINEFLREPERILRDRQQKTDSLEARLNARLRARIDEAQLHLGRARSLLAAHKPSRLIADRRRELRACSNRLRQVANNVFAEYKTKAARAGRLLLLLGPQETLDRGYSITTDERGRVLTQALSLASGQILHTRLAEGRVASEVRETKQ